MGREARRSRKGARPGKGGGRRRVVCDGRARMLARLLALDLCLETADLGQEAVDLKLLLALEFLVELAEAWCTKMLPLLSLSGIHQLRGWWKVRTTGSVAGTPGVRCHFAGTRDGGVSDVEVHLDLGSTPAYARAGGQARR